MKIAKVSRFEGNRNNGRPLLHRIDPANRGITSIILNRGNALDLANEQKESRSEVASIFKDLCPLEFSTV